jgi:tetraacyldisaccharide 4'-kinase
VTAAVAVLDPLRARVARSLERGLPEVAPLRLLAAAWATAGRIDRPLVLPAGVPVIGVGGAVLGGAGKTPVAVELARALGRKHGPVAMIGHAYRAAPRRPQVVEPDDRVEVVGDDALSSARRLAGEPVTVVVGPTRQAAVDFAVARGARVLIADGLLQSSPRRLGDGVLVLDAGAPWGSGACPPLGDLRALRAALLASADHVAVLCAAGAAVPPDLLGAVALESRIDGALDAAGARHSLAELAGLRVGLLLTVARPERIVRALAAHGIVPVASLFLADHAVPSAADLAGARTRLDVWLTTARCAAKLPSSLPASLPPSAGGDVPMLTLDHRIDVAPLIPRLRCV